MNVSGKWACNSAGYGLRDMGASFATAMAMAHGCCCVANNFHGSSAFSSDMRCDTLRFPVFWLIWNTCLRETTTDEEPEICASLTWGLRMRNQEQMVAKMSKWVEEGDVDPLMLGYIMNVFRMWMIANFGEFEAVGWVPHWGGPGPR